MIGQDAKVTWNPRTLADEGGSVAVGWVGGGVLFVRITGALSAELGAVYATELADMVARAPEVHLFGDMSGLTHYDLLARSAFVRVVLADRRRFRSITILTWLIGVGPAAHMMIDTLGPSTSVLTSRSDFESRLLLAAPLARQVLDAGTDTRTGTEPRPNAAPVGVRTVKQDGTWALAPNPVSKLLRGDEPASD
jgi:hypothetical protein